MTQTNTAPEIRLAIGIFTADGLDQIVETPAQAMKEAADLRAMGCDVWTYPAGDESRLDLIDSHMRDGKGFHSARRAAEAEAREWAEAEAILDATAAELNAAPAPAPTLESIVEEHDSTMAAHAQSIGAGRNTEAPTRPSRATARAQAQANAEALGMAAHALRDTPRASGGFPLWAVNAAPAIDDSLDLFSDYGGPFESVRYGVGLPEARQTIAI